MKSAEIYDFLKSKYPSENLKKDLTDNFSFSVMGCRSYRKDISKFLHFQQNPDELIGLIDLLKDKSIKNYMEIGIGFCTNIFFLDSLFRVISGDYQQTVGIDIEDKSELFKEYQVKFPTCSFVKTDVLNYNFDRDYDYIFIDTNQRYRLMIKTFEKCLPHARYIGFHDIANGRWGAVQLFKELSQKYEHWSWVKSGGGIGVVKVK